MTLRRRFSAKRRAYTLIEMLLVLAIIVIAAAAVAPSLRGVARSAALRSAANDVRASLTRAHVLAMKTGRIHAFQYEQNGSKFKIEPWIGDDDALESRTGDADTGFGSTATPTTPAREQTLPEDVKFALGDAAIESRGERVEQELATTGGSGSGVTWSRPILFYPDGTTADAFVVVANSHQTGIRINLRGLTAAVTVGELSSLFKLEQDAAMNQR